MLINFKVGGKYKVIENTSPYTQKRNTQTIVVLAKDGRNGFYFYNVKSNIVMHSNSFVWGFYSVTFLGMQNLKKQELNGVSWLITGIDAVDHDMGNLGPQYQLFSTLAPKKLLKKYEQQENYNCHRENGKMVLNFLNFIINGGNPKLFK